VLELSFAGCCGVRWLKKRVSGSLRLDTRVRGKLFARDVGDGVTNCRRIVLDGLRSIGSWTLEQDPLNLKCFNAAYRRKKVLKSIAPSSCLGVHRLPQGYTSSEECFHRPLRKFDSTCEVLT
jgi:hypothetical protein